MLSFAPVRDFFHSKTLFFPLQWMAACLLLIILNISNVVHAQTRVPLLFGENKNEKGEFVPMPERFTKIFEFIEKDLHIKFDLQMYPWNRAVKIASTDGGLIFGLSITAEREQIFTFSEPAVYNYLWLVTRTDKKFDYSKLLDLRGKTIGVVRGSKYGGEFDAQKNTLFKTDDDIDAYGPRLQKVLTHRVDAMIIASPFTDAIDVERQVNTIKIDEQDTSGIKPRFSVLPKPVLKDGIRFAQLKGQNDRLIQQISVSLDKYYAAESRLQKAKQSKK
ncbi:transporter substrate-binding domain-containing protein [Undibacterium sp. LX40W]|uniref:Transporter substrate-binding domain-containing protein n=1 Tax=Undibacterium nitidum TaxID=2762298 RepID=A0A923HTH1_9BURK|nr:MULTISPECIES: transporter substrate-binding domain-containing protein [Undibacterium]MBC3882277.1 transporter substrate-binding domain-containing protein [Undibacterium nitidum]MBC3892558.1 transporter substrate-binding domain-containing protein [Undibacterium sp. LX40W]